MRAATTSPPAAPAVAALRPRHRAASQRTTQTGAAGSCRAAAPPQTAAPAGTHRLRRRRPLRRRRCRCRCCRRCRCRRRRGPWGRRPAGPAPAPAAAARRPGTRRTCRRATAAGRARSRAAARAAPSTAGSLQGQAGGGRGGGRGDSPRSCAGRLALRCTRTPVCRVRDRPWTLPDPPTFQRLPKQEGDIGKLQLAEERLAAGVADAGQHLLQRRALVQVERCQLRTLRAGRLDEAGQARVEAAPPARLRLAAAGAPAGRGRGGLAAARGLRRIGVHSGGRSCSSSLPLLLPRVALLRMGTRWRRSWWVAGSHASVGAALLALPPCAGPPQPHMPPAPPPAAPPAAAPPPCVGASGLDPGPRPSPRSRRRPAAGLGAGR
jgi:hypothetical protein